MSKYDDIINLPHHRSESHKHMSAHDRAAQFAPFAALTGHGDAISETARLTENRIELDEYEKAETDRVLQLIQDKIKERPEISVTYFVPDKSKSGGKYVTVKKNVRIIDDVYRKLIMTDKSEINLDDVYFVELCN